MHSHTILLRSLLLLVGMTLAVLSARTVHGQRLEDGEREFEDKARKTRFLRADLFKGVTTASAKEESHREAADMAAKEVVYPLYWRTVGPQPPPVGKMNNQVVEFETRLLQMTKFKPATDTFQQMYCRQVVERAQEVILRGKPIAGVNAARMLAGISARRLDRGVLQSVKSWAEEVQPRLTDGNGEYLAGVLLSLLDNPKANDGVKYYLLDGLGSLLGLPKQTPALLKNDTEEKALQAAIKLVEKKGIFPRAAPRGEVEGYKILRREAVRVVAQSRSPVVGKDRPALILAKVAGNDQDVVPSPRLDERIEAAIGLARMAAGAAKFPDLQPDYAAVQIARTVADFGLQANPNLEAKTFLRNRPWKVDAARLLEAMDELKANVKTPYVQALVRQAELVLVPIEKGSAGQAAELGNWLSTNEPPTKSLFKTGADSTVKPTVEK